MELKLLAGVNAAMLLAGVKAKLFAGVNASPFAFA
jgi:hypothetical protein